MKKILLNPVVIGLAVMVLILIATYCSGFTYVNYAR